jgi:hypothetical protein
MRLSVRVGQVEHWVELREVVWTRRKVREFYEGTTADIQTIRALDDLVTACHIADADGQAYEEWAEITDEVLDNLHPAVVTFLAFLPRHAMNQQGALGEVRGGLS